MTEPINNEELNETLRKIKLEKAAGADGLPGELFRCFDTGSHAFELTKSTLNAILQTGKIPDEWRKSNIWLIHKAGDDSEVANYRPITLSNLTYKFFMTIITARLNNLLEKHHVLSNIQGGFRSERGCQQKIRLALAVRLYAKQRQRPLSSLYLDLAKAYDSVNHTALWQTLEQMKFTNNFINLLRNIYTDNTVAVLTPYGPSRDVPTGRGLRQGCPASCSLFNIFLDPILHEIEFNPDLTGFRMDGNEEVRGSGYADDLELLASDPSDLEKMAQTFGDFCVHNGIRIALIHHRN